MPNDESPARTRTFTWQDPLPIGAAAREMAGLDFLRALAAGSIPHPPICETLGFRLETVEEGFVVFVCTPGEYHYNPISAVHGGLAATLLDSATGCAVHSTLPAGHAYTTLSISVDLVRPVTMATGRMRCEGRVAHRGARVGIAEGKVIAETTGKLLARGQTTCLVAAP